MLSSWVCCCWLQSNLHPSDALAEFLSSLPAWATKVCPSIPLDGTDKFGTGAYQNHCHFCIEAQSHVRDSPAWWLHSTWLNHTLHSFFYLLISMGCSQSLLFISPNVTQICIFWLSHRNGLLMQAGHWDRSWAIRIRERQGFEGGLTLALPVAFIEGPDQANSVFYALIQNSLWPNNLLPCLLTAILSIKFSYFFIYCACSFPHFPFRLYSIVWAWFQCPRWIWPYIFISGFGSGSGSGSNFICQWLRLLDRCIHTRKDLGGKLESR